MITPVNAPGRPLDGHLQRDGALIHSRIEGHGPALVLVHGWALDLTCWNSVAPLLAREFTVLRFDRRGFGDSTGVPGINADCEDLLALLDLAGIDTAAVLGMSQGARIAIHFALRSPHRVRALLLDGAPALEAESELPLVHYRDLRAGAGVAAMQAEILKHPLMQLRGNTGGELLGAAVGRYSGSDLEEQQARHGATDAAPDLGGITMPTLILNGSLDSQARLEAGRVLCDAMPHARRVELSGAGHLAALEDPEQYARVVREFLT